MATFIEIGPVPCTETPASDPKAAVQQASAFLRQLNRTKPLPADAKYILAQRPFGSAPWITVQLVAGVHSWATWNRAHDLAVAAQDVKSWDEDALRELRGLGICPAGHELALAA